MRRLVHTVTGLSAAMLLAAVTSPGLMAQDAKKAPPPPPAKKQAPSATHKMVNAADITWGPAPAGLPAEAQAAILDGDPGKAGLFTVRLKAPDGLKVMPHWHPADEHVTVIQGTVMLGMGNKWDDSALQALNTGGHVRLPRKQNHYVQMKGETILQLTAMGPFAITYADPKDDPRKKSPSN
jgi:hypothetical protein